MSVLALRRPKSLFARKQELAAPARYYGDGGTIHASTWLDVEVVDGCVVAVWFRCQQLPFIQHHARSVPDIAGRFLPDLTGVEVVDCA